MEDVLNPTTIAIVAAVFAASSEIIGILKIDSNSNVQLIMKMVKRVFGLK